MIIAAYRINKPRKNYTCDACCEPITGPHIIAYGFAEPGDKPYRQRLCGKCARVQANTKIAYAWQKENT